MAMPKIQKKQSASPSSFNVPGTTVPQSTPPSDFLVNLRERRKRTGEAQQQALALDKIKQQREESLEGQFFGRLGPKQFKGDDRALKVLASIYEDPMLKAFIQAAQLNPQV